MFSFPAGVIEGKASQKQSHSPSGRLKDVFATATERKMQLLLARFEPISWKPSFKHFKLTAIKNL